MSLLYIKTLSIQGPDLPTPASLCLGGWGPPQGWVQLLSLLGHPCGGNNTPGSPSPPGAPRPALPSAADSEKYSTVSAHSFPTS